MILSINGFFSLFSGWAERKGAGRYYSALPDQLCASVFSTGEGDCACNIGVPFPRFIQIRENQRLQKNEKDSEEVTVAKILLQRLQLSLAESGFPATGMRGQGGDTPLLAEKGLCHNRGTLAKSGGERGIRTLGDLRHGGFQDRCLKPLDHLSGNGLNIAPESLFFKRDFAVFSKNDPQSRRQARLIPPRRSVRNPICR